MDRCACLTLIAKCGACGAPAPVNGPFRRVACPACFGEVGVSTSVLTGLCEDFEEAQVRMDPGDGQAGTVMGGGTYEYRISKREPRCAACAAPLPAVAEDADGPLACPACAARHEVYPAPAWLRELVPSAAQCLSREREMAKGDVAPVVLEESGAEPVVMACPKCGGALAVTVASRRIMRCSYCSTDVFVPDAVWTRLHPAKKAEEWFIRFAGLTGKEQHATERLADEDAERVALQGWRLRRPLRGGLKRGLGIAAIVVGVASLVVMNTLFETTKTATGAALGGPQIVLLVIAGAGLLVGIFVFAMSIGLGYKVGPGAKCKRALAALARKRHWKHQSAEYKFCLGNIDATCRGRSIEIDPDSDYAIEVDLDEGPFYLKTEPPGYPHEAARRLVSVDARFDEFFPVRWAEPAIIDRLRNDAAFRRLFLEIIYWYLDRWDGKIGMLKIDWFNIGVHLAPGHRESSGASPRYLYPDEIEPLLEDTVRLAEMLENLVLGKPVRLPKEPVGAPAAVER